MGRSSWTKEQLEEAVKQNIGIPGVLKHMGFPPMGSYYNWIKKKIGDFKLDTGHFIKPGSKQPAPPLSDEEFFVKGRKASGVALRNRLAKKGESAVCAGCGTSTWKTSVTTTTKLTLQIDHINGDSTDNRIENLRMLCPNCHSMTDTFCGRNVKRSIVVYVCSMCGISIDKGKSKCIECRKLRPHKYDNFPWPDSVELKNLLLKVTARKVAEQLGCGERALREHCREIGISNIQLWKLEENKKVKKVNVEKSSYVQKSSCPPKEVLEDLLWKYPSTKIAKMFSVSDKSISKWALKYKLSKPGVGYWAKKASLSSAAKSV